MFLRLKRAWKSMGSGLITGMSDNDTSGIMSYTIAGARTGYALLWMLIFILPFMIAIQEMSARIGALSGCGLAGNIKRHYPKALLFITAILIIVANILNIGADIAGMAAALNLLMPGVPAGMLALLMSLVVLILIIKLRYSQIVSIFKWLGMTLLAYVAAFFMVGGNLGEILRHSIVPYLEWNKEFMLVVFAIFGTTISPYLYFWQASEEADEVHQRNPRVRVCKFRPVSKAHIEKIEWDTKLGMFFSNFTAFFMVALASATLYAAGAHGMETVAQAAEALRPLAGDYAYLLFTVGIIGSGLLAIPILAGSAAYVLAEIFNWEGSLDQTFSEAREFYIVIGASIIIGLIIPFAAISAVDALFYTAILHALISPILIILIIHMANNPNIVGERTSTPVVKYLGYATFALMIATGSLVVIL